MAKTHTGKKQADLFDAIPTDKVIWEADGVQWRESDRRIAQDLGWLRTDAQMAEVRKSIDSEQRRYR